MADGYKLRVKGMDSMIKAISNHGVQAEGIIERAIQRTLLLSEAEIKRYITQLRLVDTGFYRENWQANMISKTVGVLSTNTEYALLLEFGFHGSQQIKSHTRKNKSGSTSTVKAHTRKVNRVGYGAAQHTFLFGREKLREELLKGLKELT